MNGKTSDDDNSLVVIEYALFSVIGACFGGILAVPIMAFLQWMGLGHFLH